MLTGEASHWWSSMRMLLESNGTPISWEIFKMNFYAEYFPDSVRFAKEVEFLELIQGGMLVSEYVDKFKHLLRFHTLAMDEEWQCRKFENGLRGDLKLMVAGLCIKEFPSLVERAKVLEKTKMELDRQQRQQPKVGGSISSKSGLGTRKIPYAGPSSSRYRGQSPRPPVPFGQQNPVNVRSVGHYERDYNLGRRANGQPQQAGRFQPRGGGGGGRAQVVGRVYALTGTEAASSSNLIISSYLLYGISCCVFFYSGATHSFISKECVEKLGLSVDELQFDLVVSTPAVGKVRTATYCAKCPIVVKGRQFKVNLICLPLQGRLLVLSCIVCSIVFSLAMIIFWMRVEGDECSVKQALEGEDPAA
ncbi:uncharacterized protein LOC124831497 [Vigna umbellata]|uniref:uncharacterized protein LOC124831497 n=1 Tax=Vigna umbellata TaxID=87088 RepID=UPI001F5E395A|nr:uncharacterized protein LOC124831497 [Vigna umbellata]